MLTLSFLGVSLREYGRLTGLSARVGTEAAELELLAKTEDATYRP